MRIDASGKQCPIPEIMAKKELEAGAQDLEIIVDGQTQIDNLARLGDSLGRPTTSEAFGEKFLVKFADGETLTSVGDFDAQGCSCDGDSCNEDGCDGDSCNNLGNYAVFFNTNAIGSNEGELGGNLAKMAIYTLSESDKLPAYVLFMNEGVKLVAGDCEAQIAENLGSMIEKGTKVLVCGTCLSFYGIKEELKVGTVSNMYDIIEAMQEVAKVIKL